MERHPFLAKIQVSYPTKPVLIANNDIYFRAYDNAFPDFWREDEWAREFDGYVANGNLPQIELVRFMHDHTGSFGTSIVEDNLKDPDKFNRITWEGVMGDIPYPSERNGADLRKNRAELLRKTSLLIAR